ncbi:MAG TPA: hypothetical protein VGD98_22055 [Ktedonobacteraceae bacterium]
MRVYGLTSSVKSLGWLVGVALFSLAILYPPFSSLPFSGLSYFDISLYGWRYNFLRDLQTGGLVWHILTYLHWRSPEEPMNRYIWLTTFLPYCFVAVTLPLCSLFSWRRLVDYAVRPTIGRGVLAILLALWASLALIFVLDCLCGKAMLYLFSFPFYTNLEARALISAIWITAVVQSALLSLPCLALGGLLARRQSYLETRLKARRIAARIEIHA